MRAQQERGGCRIRVAREPRNQIYKVNFSSWRVVSECLACYLPPRMPQLLLDVISGFLDCVRAGRVRPQINKSLNMSQSFLSRELVPDLCLGGARAVHAERRGKYKQE